jgi:hypothetical protein
MFVIESVNPTPLVSGVSSSESELATAEEVITEDIQVEKDKAFWEGDDDLMMKLKNVRDT